MVFAGLLHIHGVFEPFAFLVVAHNIAGCFLVDVDARAFAVVGFAVVFGIVFFVGIVAGTYAWNVEVFCFDLSGNFKCRSLEGLLRYRFYGGAVHGLEHLFGIALAEGHVGIVIKMVTVHAVSAEAFGRCVVGVIHGVREL